MKDRVKNHRLQRPSTWYTLETYKDITTSLTALDEYKDCEYVLLDCITTMVTNHMMDFDIDYDTCSQDEINMVEQKVSSEIMPILEHFSSNNKHIVIVTNEVGLGLVPAYRMGRIFRDIAGRMNQLIARKTDNVYMLISGIPQKIK